MLQILYLSHTLKHMFLILQNRRSLIRFIKCNRVAKHWSEDGVNPRAMHLLPFVRRKVRGTFKNHTAFFNTAAYGKIASLEQVVFGDLLVLIYNYFIEFWQIMLV